MRKSSAIQLGTGLHTTAVSVSRLTLVQGGKTLTEPLSFSLRPGLITCLTGPSGVGKSTLLRYIAHAARHPRAEIAFSSGSEPFSRMVAMMGQNEALLPWLTARENVVLPSALGRNPVDAESLLMTVELQGLEDRYPDQLSGGEKQRVALARTLGLHAPVLLLDEPFGKLDPPLRGVLIKRLRQWVESRGTAALVVSHQLDDVAALADTVLALRGFPAKCEESEV